MSQIFGFCNTIFKEIVSQKMPYSGLICISPSIYESPMLHEKSSASAGLFSCSKLFTPPPLRGCPQGRHPLGPPGRGKSRPKASEPSTCYCRSIGGTYGKVLAGLS